MVIMKKSFFKSKLRTITAILLIALIAIACAFSAVFMANERNSRITYAAPSNMYWNWPGTFDKNAVFAEGEAVEYLQQYWTVDSAEGVMFVHRGAVDYKYCVDGLPTGTASGGYLMSLPCLVNADGDKFVIVTHGTESNSPFYILGQYENSAFILDTQTLPSNNILNFSLPIGGFLTNEKFFLDSEGNYFTIAVNGTTQSPVTTGKRLYILGAVYFGEKGLYKTKEEAAQAGDKLIKYEAVKKVEKPAYRDNQTFTYTGGEQTPIDFASTEDYTVTGDIKATAVKADYAITVSLVTGDGKKRQWADGSTDDIQINWSITKAEQEIDIADLSGGLNIGADEDSVKVKLFDGRSPLVNKENIAVTALPEGVAKAEIDDEGNIVITRVKGSGEVQFTVTFPGDDNLEEKEITFGVNVEVPNGFYVNDKLYRSWENFTEEEVSGPVEVTFSGNTELTAPLAIPQGVTQLTFKGEDGGANVTVAGTGALLEIASGKKVTLGGNLNISAGNGDVYLASVNGGALEVSGASVKSFKKTAIAVADGTAEISGGTFEGNSSEQNGGVVDITGGALTVTGGEFINNSAANGGVVAANGGTVTLSGGKFSGNAAKGNGGAVYVESPSADVTLGGCEIYNNTAALGAGASLADGAAIKIKGSAAGKVTDSIGINGNSRIEIVGDEINAGLTAEFADPENQLSGNAGNDNFQYVQSKVEANTNAKLKEFLRVKNAGYTFGTAATPAGEVKGALYLVESGDIVAIIVGDGVRKEYKSIEQAIKEAAEASKNGKKQVEVQFVQHHNANSGVKSNEVEINQTLEIPEGADLKFSSVVRKVSGADNTTVEYVAADAPEYGLTKIIRGESLMEEMIAVGGGASLTIGNVILDGGAVWPSGGINLTDDGKGGAGTAVTGNTGITAHAPVVVNQGNLTLESGTICNNDNNYAAPGAGFGSQNYGGGVRNEAAGVFTMTGGAIKDCYSREGGAIMNVNKQNPNADQHPKVTVSGGEISGNYSQMKGAAIQSIYGGAETEISGEVNITGNVSLYDMGVASVEEGASLSISGGTIAAASDDDIAIYLYNQYSEADIAGSTSGAIPYVEGKKAGELKIGGAADITGKAHIDDPCIANGTKNNFDPFLQLDSAYSGGNLTLDGGNKQSGALVKGATDKVTAPQNDMSGLTVVFYFTVEEDGKNVLRACAYEITVGQTEGGKLDITGACDSSVTSVKVTIDGQEYALAKDGGVWTAQVKVDGTSVEITALTFEYAGGNESATLSGITFGAVLFDKDGLILSAPGNTYYLDEKGGYKALAESGMLPNDIAVDGQGNITLRMGDGEGAEVRKVYIGARAAAPAESSGDVLLSDVAASSQSGKHDFTIQGKAGLEYNLLDVATGELLGGWVKADENGKVTFGGLDPDKNYTVVARTPADGETLPSAYANRGALVTLSAEEAAALAEYLQAYNAVKDKLWTDEGSYENLASKEDLKAAVEKYGALSAKVKGAEGIFKQGESLSESYSRALAKGWNDLYADAAVKASAQMVKDYNALADNGAYGEAAQTIVSETYKQKINDYKQGIKEEVKAAFESAEDYEDIIENMCSVVENYDLNPADGDIDGAFAAIEGIPSKANATKDAAKTILEAFNKAMEGADSYSVDILAELSTAYSRAIEGLMDHTADVAQYAEEQCAAIEAIVEKAAAKNAYSQAYKYLTGSTAEPDNVSLQSVTDEASAIAAIKELAQSLKESAKSEAAKEYIQAVTDKLAADANAKMSDYVEGFKNAKAIAEYLDAYKNICGEEAETAKVQQDIDAIKAADDIAEVNQTLGEKLIAVINEKYSAIAGDSVLTAAKEEINKAVEYANSLTEANPSDPQAQPLPKLRSVAQIADKLAGFDKKAAESVTLDALAAENGIGELTGDIAKYAQDLVEETKLGVFSFEYSEAAWDDFRALTESKLKAQLGLLGEVNGDGADVVEEAKKAVEYIGGATSAADVESRKQGALPGINGRRFLNGNAAANKPFEDVGANDGDALEAAKKAYDALDDSVKQFVDDQFKEYEDKFAGAVEDRLFKAQFEAEKQAAKAEAESYLKECDADSEFVTEINGDCIEEIEGEQYDKYTQSTGRAEHLAEEKKGVADKLESAKKKTRHAQAVQRSVNEASEFASDLKASGNYDDAQQAEIDGLLSAFESAAKATAESADLESLAAKAHEDIGNVSANSATAGDLKADKTSLSGTGEADYGEGDDGEIWGIVQNQGKISGNSRLVIAQGTAKANDVNGAIKKGNFKAAAGSGLSEGDYSSLVKDREFKAAFDVYLEKDGLKITEHDGVYTVKILMKSGLRSVNGLQVVRVNGDSVELYKTAIEDGKYIVYSTSELSEVQIIGEKTVNLLWLVILLAVIIVLEIAAILFLVFFFGRTGKGGKGTNAGAVAPLGMLAVILPEGAVAACIVLGVVAVLLAAACIVLAVFKVRARKAEQEDKSGESGENAGGSD